MRKLRVVVKIGTSSLLQSGAGEEGERGGAATGSKLALVHLATTVEVLSLLRSQGHDVVLVSSGAVGAGCHRKNLRERPGALVARQALAAIGQVHLMAKYDVLFSSMGHLCAQVLLTYENFVNRTQFFNARNTFEELFKERAIPIVNENDTVGIHELKADNDKLAGMVSNMIGADLVFLMTDVNGVFTANPRVDPDAQRISFVEDFDDLRRRCKLGSGKDSEWGTGGMAAKISAAALSTSLGVRTVIMHADDCNRIPAYVDAESLELDRAGAPDLRDQSRFTFGTTFERNPNPPRERKRWIRSLPKRGTLVVDDGAAEAIKEGNTLFSAGVVDVIGSFTAMEPVVVKDRTGVEIASGLCSFSSRDLLLVMGKSSEETYEQLRQSGHVIERGNLDVPSSSLTSSSSSSSSSSSLSARPSAKAPATSSSSGGGGSDGAFPPTNDSHLDESPDDDL